MSGDINDFIKLFEAELDLIEGGGYGLPAGEPRHENPMFRQSLVCINHWIVPGREPRCGDDCMLMRWVPPERKNEVNPCHFIPLNDAGETVRSLEGNQARLEEAVKTWLRTTIQRLKEERDAPPTRP